MADIKPQTRTSVIQLNPAYLTTQSGRENTAPVTGDASDGSDSEDEIVNVDEPDEMETETVPLTQAERLAENLRTQNSPEKKINSDTSSATPPFGEKRRSPKARFEPYRKEKNEIDENENRTSKSNKTTALQSVVEEIKKQAAMMAQKPISRSGSGSISASGFLPAQVCKLVLSSTTNSNEVAPNAVIQLNKNNNRNEEQATTEDCQNRPFKCHLCNVGFRISGHLSRHYKSRAHINQMQKRPDSAMLFTATPDSTKIFEKAFEVQDSPIDLSINAKKVQANPSPPNTPPKPVFKAIKLGKSVSPTAIDPSRTIKPVNRISPITDVGSVSVSPISSQKTSGTPATSMKSISPTSLPKLKEQRPSADVNPSQSATQSITSEVTENGTRRFRCNICDIGFRFQGHLDRHLRSTTHMSMEEAVRRTGRRPNTE